MVSENREKFLVKAAGIVNNDSEIDPITSSTWRFSYWYMTEGLI